jgi:hypothetical protein
LRRNSPPQPFEHVFTWSRTFAHFLRQENGCLQAAQTPCGRSAFYTLGWARGLLQRFRRSVRSVLPDQSAVEEHPPRGAFHHLDRRLRATHPHQRDIVPDQEGDAACRPSCRMIGRRGLLTAALGAFASSRSPGLGGGRRRVSQGELDDAPGLHGLWLENRRSSRRADFASCNLSGHLRLSDRLTVSLSLLGGSFDPQKEPGLSPGAVLPTEPVIPTSSVKEACNRRLSNRLRENRA